ncbi:MAG: UDP-N-acetylmuramate dehydrogenase [Thermoanaerobaculaceae bacterium]|nr:UDP-N-acetylmuramate dehydrogenase [Thermoanaerobaculaceae bacterium]
MPTADWGAVLARLGSSRGAGLEVSEGVPLAGRTTFKIGGPARVVARCRSREAVLACLATCGEAGVPWLVLGLGGNVLVPDAGLDAVVLVLEGELAGLERRGPRFLVGGGLPLAKLVRAAVDASLAGVECLGGIPATVGGALAGNAGAYGQEILDVLDWAEVVDGEGQVRRMERWEIEGGYRWSVLGTGRVVTTAEFVLVPERPEVLAERVRLARERRRAAIPPEPSAGSIFRNPPGDHAGRLLELVGCKGLRRGGAMVSQQHANVIVNLGGASAADVRELIAEMARRVRERFDVVLELEVKVLEPDGSVTARPPHDLA